MSKFFFAVNREIRSVPLNWQHPRDKTGEYIPLSPRRLLTEAVFTEYVTDGVSPAAVEAMDMPDFSGVPTEQLGLQAYETTSEGTPISPVYPDTPGGRFALVRYCAKHETVFANFSANLQQWAQLLFHDDAVFVDVTNHTLSFSEETHPRSRRITEL